MKIKGKSIFEVYLLLLGVKHTESFSGQYFNEHPHKYNLYGLSKMLSYYGIENEAVQIPDKENNILNIGAPFIAPFGGDFVAVHKIEPDQVSFIMRGVNHELSAAKFVESWSGVVMFTQTSEKSIEPDYRQHKKTELFDLLKKIALLGACGLIACLAYILLIIFRGIPLAIGEHGRRVYQLAITTKANAR